VNVYAHKLDRNFPTITLDIDGYKAKHFEKLKTIALDAALKAKRLREPVELRPMSSQARRIIHLTLKIIQISGHTVSEKSQEGELL